MSRTYIYSRAHIIFSTKNRHAMINNNIDERLLSYIGAIVKDQKGKLLAASTMPDHIHLFVSLRSEPSIATLLRLIKTNSSKWVKETFEHCQHFAWQLGYGYFSVSPSQKEATISYIHNQKKHHAKKSFKEEFIIFLKKHAIDYDERYLWD